MIKIKIMINKTNNIFLLIYFFNICIYLRNISQNKIELFKERINRILFKYYLYITIKKKLKKIYTEKKKFIQAI